jgi:potassium efflux system protein
MLWREAIPAFESMGKWALWTYGETVDGKAVEHSVTFGGVLLAALVGVVAYFATKNIGGMLDIILLRRLQLQADANYAIKTVARYVIAGIGIAVATQLIGINWSRAQWLVAALGVGLGFGLQEIVANFVSGLIVLGERPIRIGDIVTVGEVSGTVTRIRARATVVTDWDNKEVMIPNKAFITERVTNWTLSSGVTRVLIKVGVAYGTDPERVCSYGFDLGSKQLDGIRAGNLDGSLGQQPFIQGLWPVVQLYLQIDRGVSAANVDTQAQLITKDNVETVGKRFEN